MGHSPLDSARNASLWFVSKDCKRKVIEILEREEKKLRK